MSYFFVVAFLFMRPAEEKKINPKADYIIEMTWPDGSFDDVDLWLLTPTQKRVGYSSKEQGIYNLERDDRGIENDVTIDKDGVVRWNKINKEVISLRGFEPGLHIVNIHYFARIGKSYQFGTQRFLEDPKDAPPYKVHISLYKLNPKYQIVVTKEIEISTPRQEFTAFQFTLDQNGNVTDINYEQYQFITNRGTFGPT